MYNNIPTKVLTGEVRLSYVNLVAPRCEQHDPHRDPVSIPYTLLIPKTDTAVKANIDASIEAAAKDAQAKIWGGVRPPVLLSPSTMVMASVRTALLWPECKGCWVITASTKNKPQWCLRATIGRRLLPQDIYSGMYARVTINFFGYNTAGKRGVGCGLGNVMKTRDGEPLAGGASAAADFAVWVRPSRLPLLPYSRLRRRDAGHPGPDELPNTGYAAPAPAPLLLLTVLAPWWCR